MENQTNSSNLKKHRTVTICSGGCCVLIGILMTICHAKITAQFLVPIVIIAIGAYLISKSLFIYKR